MTVLDWVGLVLLLGVVTPGAWMAARGRPRQRLVGLEFASIGVLMTLTVLAVAWRQTFSLIVPLVLAVLTFPGTLVYARLLAGDR